MTDRVTSQVGPWAMVPVWVLAYIKGSDLAVYIALRSFADRQGDARPKTKTIAARAGVHPVTAKKAIARMRDLGLLRTEQWHRDDGSIGGCHYHLRDIAPEGFKGLEDGQDDQDGDGAAATTQEPSGYQGGSPAATRVVAQRLPQEHTRENTPEEHTTTTAPPADDLADQLADAVMDGGGTIMNTITRSTLTRECQRLAVRGWTPRTLRKATRDRNWTGCHAGAVIAWLRDLDTPPPPKPRRAPAPEMPCCPIHPEIGLGNGASCIACDDDATDGPPPGWRNRRLTTVAS